VDELTMSRQKNKFRAEALHGELTQNQRTRVIEQFKARRFDMLIATDVAARGIDVNDLTHVINYSLPTDKDIYTHRIGRTGRAGKKGVAISLFTPSEGGRFAMLRKASGGRLEQRSLPDAKAIIAAKKARFREELESLMPQVNNAYLRMAEELSAVYDPEILIASLLEMKFHKELLHENYPPLSRGGKRERSFGSDRERSQSRHERNSSDREKRPPRRKERAFDAASAADNGNGKAEQPQERNNKKRNKFDKGGKKAEFSGEKHSAPRKKLRDWAIELTDGAPEMPRYKVKKRK
jgi:ATP-dependent RNA helicase DeaD